MGADLNKAFIQMRGWKMCELKGKHPKAPHVCTPTLGITTLELPQMWFKQISSKWKGNLIVYMVMGKNTQRWTKNNS